LKYSHNYSKLDKQEYTTIRRYSKAQVGDIVREVYPKGNHFAKVKRVVRTTLREIPTKLLLEDTDKQTREEALLLIQSFYRKQIGIDERLYLYYLDKRF